MKKIFLNCKGFSAWDSNQTMLWWAECWVMIFLNCKDLHVWDSKLSILWWAEFCGTVRVLLLKIILLKSTVVLLLVSWKPTEPHSFACHTFYACWIIFFLFSYHVFIQLKMDYSVTMADLLQTGDLRWIIQWQWLICFRLEKELQGPLAGLRSRL